MFIVKAVRSLSTNISEEQYTVWQCDHYSVWQCDHYSVRPPYPMATSDKNYIHPVVCVDLLEKSEPLQPQTIIASIDIGGAHDQDQFDTVYVMNDRGKTIDTITSRRQAEYIATSTR